ncbi:MAG: hypothetical protein GY765_30615 [bacterium]|nr:hypothetical protein [bacterium]
MSLNTIDTTFPVDSEAQVVQSIEAIDASMEFLIELDIKERRRLSKMSRKALDFVKRSQTHANVKPDLLPALVSIEKFNQSVALIDTLNNIHTFFNAVGIKLKDTLLMLKSETYAIARLFYTTAKHAYKEGVKGTEPIVKDLAIQYASTTNKDKGGETPPDEPAPTEEQGKDAGKQETTD